MMNTKQHSAQAVAIAQRKGRQSVASLTDAGNLLHQQGQLNEALEAFKLALELVGRNKTSPDKRTAICHYNVARTYAGLGNTDEAVEHYEHALAIRPKFPHALNNLGMLLNELGRFEDAALNFKKAISLDVLLASSHYGLGVALQNLGDNTNAAFCYQKALTFNPDHYSSWANLGLICYTIGSVDVAINCYNEAIAICAEYPEIFYQLGLAYMSQGKFRQASQAFSRALEIDPNYEHAQDALREAMYFNLDSAAK